MSRFDLSAHGVTVADVRRNLVPARLYEEAVRFDASTRIADNGALVAYSGQKTGRSPLDKRIVRQSPSDQEVWWGGVNVPLERLTYEINRERAVDYLNTRPWLYCVDGFAGWDPRYRLKVRVICARPYHAMFMHVMLIRPTAAELAEFEKPDFVIYNAGQFPANSRTSGMTSKTSIDLSLEDGEAVILGTEYAGEMKKGVFTVMNYFMPRRGVLSMHCAATADRNTGQTSLLFGLSGTGKTTLSADPKRLLIGDDEHCWSEQGIFNIEGGCYAKAIHLTPESEPDIFQALRFGAVLENVVLDDVDRRVNYDDPRITENTRGAYPIEYISNSRVPCVGGHPADVIFLTCDAFGVLPPVSRLTPAQAMYYFISGYTAKVAGTEVGVTEPQATFSPCFGGPFLVWRPAKYAQLLSDKITKHGANVWLVNTGWSGGPYGVGKRMPLAVTRAIIDGIHAGLLREAPVMRDPVFGFDVITQCPGAPKEILVPRNAWQEGTSFDQAARKLAQRFQANFKSHEGAAEREVQEAGPAGLIV